MESREYAKQTPSMELWSYGTSRDPVGWEGKRRDPHAWLDGTSFRRLTRQN
jgi:hypothetical protein